MTDLLGKRRQSKPVCSLERTHEDRKGMLSTPGEEKGRGGGGPEGRHAL